MIGRDGAVPLAERLANGVLSYCTYIYQLVWPQNLAAFYPLPIGDPPVGSALVAAIFLLLVSIAAVALRQRAPYFFAGWFWYLVMLLPVIGIVQIGLQSHADRYTYLPQIGLYLLLAWAAADLTGRWRNRHIFIAGLSVVILAALTLQAHTQASYWKDSESLWTHAIASATDNAIAEGNLGNALYLKGKFEQSIEHFQKALLADTRDAFVQSSLGAERKIFLQKRAYAGVGGPCRLAMGAISGSQFLIPSL